MTNDQFDELNSNLENIADKLNEIAMAIGECGNGLAFLRGTYNIAEMLDLGLHAIAESKKKVNINE